MTTRALALLLLLATGCEQSLEIGSVSSTNPSSDDGAANVGGSVAGSGAIASGGSAPSDSGNPTQEPGGARAGSGNTTSSRGTPNSAAEPSLLWSSGFEPGDTSEWSDDGAAVGGQFLHVATLAASTEQAHSGLYSVKLGFDTSDGQYHWSELYRRAETGSAYYSAWFYLVGAHTPAVYWTIFDFFSEGTPGDLNTRRGLWDLNLNAQSLYFYDESTQKFADASPQQPYPVGRWFQLEALLDYQPQGMSQLTIWQDGTQILDRHGLISPAATTLYWGLGSQTDQLSPPGCEMYIDDVAISRTRLGR